MGASQACLQITWPILIVEVRYRTDRYPAVGYFFYHGELEKT